jgi:hypothetical protein
MRRKTTAHTAEGAEGKRGKIESRTPPSENEDGAPYWASRLVMETRKGGLDFSVGSIS